jgi:uncharacterized protein YutE (UPF0331/DUF86 family)
MYFVNHEQIEQRLCFVDVIVETCKQVLDTWDEGSSDRLQQFTQERVLHLAIESVTDVGSLLIDAFILRDASSYEDIVEILHGEQAFDHPLAEFLIKLVKLRKPLVQDYVNWDRNSLQPLMQQIPDALPKFVISVQKFIQKELA